MTTASEQTVSPTVGQALQQAVAHHGAGRLADAERLYRAILEVEPQHPDANHNLGALAVQLGRPAAGLPLLRAALEADPSVEQFWLSYAAALLATGQAGEAKSAMEDARQRGFNSPAAHALRQSIDTALNAPSPAEIDRLLGLFEAGNYVELERLGRELLDRHPGSGFVWKAFGIALRVQGKDALYAMRKAAELLPDDAEAHSNLGEALKELGQLGESAASCRRALAIKADYAEAHANLGNALKELGQLDASVASFRRALELKPDFAGAHNSLGAALKGLGQIHESVASYRRALELKPDFAEAHNNMGNALKELEQLDESVASFRRALELKPDFAEAHSNMLFGLNYHPDLSAEEIYRAYQEYDRRHCIPMKPVLCGHNNDRNIERRLRVGYVSPDYCRHPVRFFLEPLLAHHDTSRWEVYAYAELNKEDDVTARYKCYVEHWVATRGMSDGALAERIRNDGIDILVELAGHTAGNRLLTFARKPAPVSVSWLGYGYTTGVSAIDYYLTDAVCVPQGSENLFAEQPWRIAAPAYVFRPNADMGEVGSLPALRRGHITFGTLTRAVRINHRTLRAWAEILKAVPNSRLVIDSTSFKSLAMRERVAARFAGCGIERERLEIGFNSPPWDVLRGTDIGLDCFPHNSGTTLFETLYMGVPYITLAGRPSVGRLGGSILHGVGHPEWIATSEDEYIAKAVELAGDIARLAEIRAALRGEMQASPLMDEAGFARKVEAAYRGMWQNWCERGDQFRP